MRRFQGQIAHVRTLAYAPDGGTLISGGNGGLIRHWSPFEGRIKRKHRFGYERVTGLSYSPDGSMVATSLQYGAAHLWAAEDGQKIGMLQDRRAGTSTIEFGPDSRSLLSTGWNGERSGQGAAALWDVPSRKIVARFSTRLGIWCASFRPDGERVAIGSANYWISIWNPTRFPEGVPILDWDEPTRWVHPGESERGTILQEPGARCLRYSPDGHRLAASAGWSIHIYDLDDGRKLATCRGHRQMVKSLAYSPDDRILASGSHDGTVRFWDVATGEERSCYDWGLGKVDCVVFAPDGMTVAAGGEGGIVVWDVETA